jgi:hypothetical protein
MLQRLLQNSLCFQVFGGYVAIFHASDFFFWMNNMKYSILTMRSLISLIVRGSTHALCFKMFDFVS